VESAVALLQEATFSGIVEYACLKQVMRDSTPPLPDSITKSDLARHLSTAAPIFALGNSLDAPQRADTIEVRPLEFISLLNEEHLESDFVQCFEIRFNRSASNAGLPRTVSDQLQVALHEMMENSLIHSHAAIAPVAGYSVADGIAEFSVFDLGIGVLASLKSCPEYNHISLHKDAIRAALQDGISRFGAQKGGFGFREVFKALIASWGELRFRSGEGCISMSGSHLANDQGIEHFPPLLPGFQVSVACRASAPAASNENFLKK
jgi:hypothetical protein